MSFNILLVGDRKSGKTTWLDRIFSGEWTKEYVPTIVIPEIQTPVTVSDRLTNGKRPKFNIFEINSDVKFPEHIPVHAAIIFIDSTLSRSALRASHAKWYRLITEHYPDVPLTVFRTKNDLKPRIKSVYVSKEIPVTAECSSRSCYKLYNPLEALMPELIGPGVRFAFNAEGEVELSAETLAKYEAMLAAEGRGNLAKDIKV